MNTSTNPISSAGSNLSHYSWSPTETSSCQCTLWYSARVSQQCVGDKKLHHNHNMRQYTRDFTNVVFVRTLPGALTPFFSANDLATVFFGLRHGTELFNSQSYRVLQNFCNTAYRVH